MESQENPVTQNNSNAQNNSITQENQNTQNDSASQEITIPKYKPFIEEVEEKSPAEYKDMSIKINILFWLKIFSWIVVLIVTIVSFFAGLKYSVNVDSLLEVLKKIISVAIFINLFFGVLQCGITLYLGKYYKHFTYSGLWYIGIVIFDFIYKFSGKKGIQVVISLLWIPYFIFFVEGISKLLEAPDISLTDKWDDLKKLYLGSYIAIPILIFLAIIPGINILALFAMYILIIVVIIAMVWEIVLLRETRNSLIIYLAKPKEEKTE